MELALAAVHAERVLANLAEVHDQVVADVVLVELGAVDEYLVGEVGERRSAVRAVELDAEVGVGAARVVAGGEYDAAERLVLDDARGHGRRGHEAVLGDDETLDVRIGGAHLDDALDALDAEEAAVAAHHQAHVARLRLGDLVAERVEVRLDEVLHVVGLLEDLGALAQTGRAGLLVAERRARYLCACHLHDRDVSSSSSSSIILFFLFFNDDDESTCKRKLDKQKQARK